jgi:hypothetical protein
MGTLANCRLTNLCAYAVTCVIVSLNVFLLVTA